MILHLDYQNEFVNFGTTQSAEIRAARRLQRTRHTTLKCQATAFRYKLKRILIEWNVVAYSIFSFALYFWSFFSFAAS